MKNKIVMIAVLAMLVAPVAFAKSADNDKGFGWTKRINSWSQSIKAWSSKFLENKVMHIYTK